mmetsp:Transcript_33398/g.131710  ORF Transcript_33398/g.131710 Transcript_33398/m.131710 type:complete len:100 (-) Transcript_33398:419-718(-)
MKRLIRSSVEPEPRQRQEQYYTERDDRNLHLQIQPPKTSDSYVTLPKMPSKKIKFLRQYATYKSSAGEVSYPQTQTAMQVLKFSSSQPIDRGRFVSPQL